MNSVEYEYLRKNGFQNHGLSDMVSSNIILDGKQTNEFHDERQLAFLKTQFGEDFKYIVDMKILVKFFGAHEYDVSLKWTVETGYGDIEKHESNISGEDLYNLISQVIVIAKTFEYDLKCEE